MIELKFVISVSRCNGSMHLKIFQHDHCCYQCDDIPDGISQIEISANHWPPDVRFELSNRNEGDTETDTNGVIIQDKAIEVIGIFINNFPLHVDLIDQVFECHRHNHDKVTHENWWSFNGTVFLKLDSVNPMRFLLSKHNQYDINRLEWTKYAK